MLVNKIIFLGWLIVMYTILAKHISYQSYIIQLLFLFVYFLYTYRDMGDYDVLSNIIDSTT